MLGKKVSQEFEFFQMKKGSIRYAPKKDEDSPLTGAFYFNKIHQLAGRVPKVITLTVEWDNE